MANDEDEGEDGTDVGALEGMRRSLVDPRHLYSGTPLTPLERAQIREIIELHRHASWLRKRIWAGLMFAVGIPSAIVALWQAIEAMMKWFKS